MAVMSNDERPVYLRLRDTIAAMILEGRVADGDPLPSVRSLAAEHGANPLTVAKAYQTFQEEGLIVVKRGIGMFVADGATARLRATERREFLENRWPGIAAQIRRLGLEVEDLIDRAIA
jgi:GntR family transcriptional regulator